MTAYPPQPAPDDAIVLLGPTCSGKSAAAVALAKRLDGEVVSCDSMQVYRMLPVGTAQPGDGERGGIPHHLVGFLELDQRWDASCFVPAAQELLCSIRHRGKRAIVAGGTGLYARALCYGMSLLPSDHELALKLRAECATQEGREVLLAELASTGDAFPEDIRLNPRHLARAVEVLRLTGKPPWRLQSRSAEPLPGFRQFCIVPDVDELKERIARRTDAMLKSGWLEEAAAAYQSGLAEAPTAWQALGYREIRSYLGGELKGGLAELRQLLVFATIRYARRQLTWFRHQHPGAIMLPMDTPERTAEAIVASVSGIGSTSFVRR